MSKKIINKEQQDNFLKLSESEQIAILNNAIKEKGTEGISNLGFSYKWACGKMAEKNIFYVASIKKFIKEEKENSLSSKEISILRTIINDYNELITIKKGNGDIRLNAGFCSDKTTTRSIVVDYEINKEWNEFCKKHAFINNKDLVSSALKKFMDIYK